jgi:ABC-2 type transport system permease protein
MSESGVIHDIGYQRYAGPRLGRGYIFGSLYVHGLRTAFGLGRGVKSKVFPWSVVAVTMLVAAILVVIRQQTGVIPLTYLQYTSGMSWPVIFLVAVVAPELVSRDLASGVLPLYLSRPLRTSDYAFAKVAALVSAVWLVLGVPQLLMFAGAAFGTDDGLTGVGHELLDLLPGLVYAAMFAVLFAALGLLVASLTGKRAFAAAGIVGVFLTTAAVAATTGALSPTAADLAGLASPSTLLAGVGYWLWGEEAGRAPVGDFGPLYAAVGVLLAAAAVGLTLLRYRKAAAA